MLVFVSLHTWYLGGEWCHGVAVDTTVPLSFLGWAIPGVFRLQTVVVHGYSTPNDFILLLVVSMFRRGVDTKVGEVDRS